ncbi:AbrB/MazE/SpoVT family DNA-binding domain-containing protein [Bacillus pseudomycoides]|uniref:AbrB/MazE/SpoVT family DNA-binding domain-containing protein n=1 Tax=Bacillus pseudomycoides TaxID=64104 RepID=UPI000BECC98C|nr:AbrB/MazE/SpoVT family DNA-binding domain-containing protein [Bacillus pseudomycoides]PEB42270.1 AbrB family transcriptional regulator [Bacillus pseudomycoides]
MKSTGITRKIDELGRIVIPMEIRRTLGIKEKDAIEIFVEDNDKIVLKKYEPYGSCVITGEVSNENVAVANGKIMVSKEGAEKLLKELEGIVVHS